MINTNKKYRTQDGRQVRIYAVESDGDFPVHGAILKDGGWSAAAWPLNGEYLNKFGEPGPTSLVEDA